MTTVTTFMHCIDIVNIIIKSPDPRHMRTSSKQLITSETLKQFTAPQFERHDCQRHSSRRVMIIKPSIP
jgi:hypothetical protein